MNWLPKGQRPDAGRFHARSPEGAAGFALFGEDECFAILLDDDARGDFRLIEYPDWKQLDFWSFAPATPPPDWDLVEALETELMSLGYVEAFEATDVERVVRAYLAGEPKP